MYWCRIINQIPRIRKETTHVRDRAIEAMEEGRLGWIKYHLSWRLVWLRTKWEMEIISIFGKRGLRYPGP